MSVQHHQGRIQQYGKSFAIKFLVSLATDSKSEMSVSNILFMITLTETACCNPMAIKCLFTSFWLPALAFYSFATYTFKACNTPMHLIRAMTLQENKAYQAQLSHTRHKPMQ